MNENAKASISTALEKKAASDCDDLIRRVAGWFKTQPGTPKILLKIACNAGDSIHGMPILKHYRCLHPDATIAFMTCQSYAPIHELNPDITKGGLFLLPNELKQHPKLRLPLWEKLRVNLRGVKVITPAIFPFGEVHKENAWCHAVIADQYLANAGIADRKPLGGRRYIIRTTQAEKRWAEKWVKAKQINLEKAFIVEYNSYSHPVWEARQWVDLFSKMRGYHFIGLAGKNEGHLPGMIDGRGVTWRQTVALANLVPKVIGVGSGITMLAAGAERQPKIYEINVPDSVSMKHCGYADSVQIFNATPDLVAKEIVK